MQFNPNAPVFHFQPKGFKLPVSQVIPQEDEDDTYPSGVQWHNKDQSVGKGKRGGRRKGRDDRGPRKEASERGPRQRGGGRERGEGRGEGRRDSRGEGRAEARGESRDERDDPRKSQKEADGRADARADSRILFDPRRDDPLKFSRHQKEEEPKSILSHAAPTKTDRASERLSRLHHDLLELEKQVAKEDHRLQQRIQDFSDRFSDAADSAQQWHTAVRSHHHLTENYMIYLFQTLHPDRTEVMRRLPRRQRIPARIWQHAIFALLEMSHQASYLSPEALDYAIDLTYFAYSTYTAMLDQASEFAFAWFEGLADVARFRLAIETEAASPHIQFWSAIAKRWYFKASSQSRGNGRIWHRLGVVTKDDPLGQLTYFCQALTASQAYSHANESVLAQIYELDSQELDRVDRDFLRLQHTLFMGVREGFGGATKMFVDNLDGAVSSQQWRRMGLICLAAMQDFGNSRATGEEAVVFAYDILRKIITSDLATNNAALGYVLMIMARLVHVVNKQSDTSDYRHAPWEELASWLSCYLPNTVEWERTMEMDVDADEEQIVYPGREDDNDDEESEETTNGVAKTPIVSGSTSIPEDWYLAGMAWTLTLTCRERKEIEGETIVNPRIEEGEPTGNKRLTRVDTNADTTSFSDGDDLVADLDKLAMETQSVSTGLVREGSNAESDDRIPGFEHNERPFVVKVPVKQIINSKLKEEREHVGKGEEEAKELVQRRADVLRARWQRVADYAMAIARRVKGFEIDVASKSFVVNGELEEKVRAWAAEEVKSPVSPDMEIDEDDSQDITRFLKRARAKRSALPLPMPMATSSADDVKTEISHSATIVFDVDAIICHLDIFKQVVHHVGAVASAHWTVVIPRIVAMELIALSSHDNELGRTASEAVEMIAASIGALTSPSETRLIVKTTRGKRLYNLSLVNDVFDFEHDGKRDAMLRTAEDVFVACVEQNRKKKSADTIVICGNATLQRRVEGISPTALAAVMANG